jgi:AcrR family transcriptional regulator
MIVNDDGHVLKHALGRPKSEGKRDVAQLLLDATKQLLREHFHFDLTEKHIAAAAGVNDKMIHYYFGDKDGLIFDLIAQLGDEIVRKLQALDELNSSTPFLTRHILQILVDAYYLDPWIARVSATEFQRKGSVICSGFVNRYGPMGIGISRLRKTFDRLVKEGAYDKSTNTKNVALSMFCIVIAPYSLTPMSLGLSADLEELKQDEWIDFVADMFERKLGAVKADAKLAL